MFNNSEEIISAIIADVQSQVNFLTKSVHEVKSIAIDVMTATGFARRKCTCNPDCNYYILEKAHK